MSPAKSKKLKTAFIFAIVVCALSAALLELGSYLLIEFKVINPQLDNGTGGPETSESMYIPHPYFGYVYSPSTTLYQHGWMKSNSEGFIDDEFPGQKEPGQCLIGLFGGSAAMSWGVANEKDRISRQMTALLETGGPRHRCHSVRVLNFGIGSHHIYQAVQIFSYYHHLLDGAIFYFGNNECSHPSVLSHRREPVQFPEFATASIAGLDHWTVLKIRLWRSIHRAVSEGLASGWSSLHLARASLWAMQNFSASKIEKLNQRLDKNADHFAQMVTDSYSRSMSPFLENDYLYRDATLRTRIMLEAMGAIFTRPLEQVAEMARVQGLPVLLVIQPMRATSDHSPSSAEKDLPGPFPEYQSTCLSEVLPPALKTLQGHGLPVLDLNSGHLYQEVPQLFIDAAHLTVEGNLKTAQILQKYVQEHWHL